MGKDYSSSDAPFGFQPYDSVLRANLYAVQTAPTIGVYHFDLVQHGGTALSTKFGVLPIIEDGSVIDGDAQLLGSVIAIFDENMAPAKYIAAAEAGDGTVAGYIMVADHPDQLFLAQEDGATNAIDLNETGYNADVICVALNAGSSTTGLSTQQIDSDSAANTEALQVRLVKPHEDDTVADDSNPYARWVVMINEHFFGATKGGA